MNKEQKAAAVTELRDRLSEAEAIFAVDYRGISVTQAAELRTRLGEADAVFKVVKNRLAKRAAADAGTEGLENLFEGPTALTMIQGDAVIAAKAIHGFAREHEVLEFKGGIMDGQPLDADGFAAIARLPALEVLHAQLVGMTASPLSGLVRGLGSMVSGLAVALGQIAEQGQVGDDAEPEEDGEKTEDEPSEEATPSESAEPSASAPGPAGDGAEGEASGGDVVNDDEGAEAPEEE